MIQDSKPGTLLPVHPIWSGIRTVATILSIGMSDDYLLAIQNGSNMIRVGSRIFGKRKLRIYHN